MSSPSTQSINESAAFECTLDFFVDFTAFLREP